MRKSIIGGIILVFILTACFKEPDFSFTPEISFDKISKEIRLDQFSGAVKDSIIVSINFKDGDGDLGYNSEQIGKDVAKTDFNYVVKPFRKVKGKFESFTPPETFSGFYFKLDNNLQSGPLEGVLSRRIQIESAFWPVKKDTLRFDIYIKDRAGNQSNTISTDIVVVNDYNPIIK